MDGIAEKCGMSHRTVVRTIAWLEDHQYLAVVRRRDGINNRQLSNQYQLSVSR